MGAAQGIRAGRAFIELGMQDKFSAGLKRAQQQLAAFGAGLRAIGLRMIAIGSAAIAPFVASIRTFAGLGDQLDKMSIRTGVSVEALSELGFAAELSGADIESLETGIRKMQKTITEAAGGSAAAAEALADLGLSAQAVAAMSPEAQFKLIADRLSAIGDPTRRAALAMEIFGRSGTRLLPLLEDGAAGINRMQREARALGLTMSTRTARQAALLNDTLHTTWRVLKQVSVAVGAALAPNVVELSNAVTRVAVHLARWIKQNRELVLRAAKIAAAIIAAGAALVGFGAAASVAAMAIGGIAKALAVVNGAMVVVTGLFGAILSPISLIIAGVTALGVVLARRSAFMGRVLQWLGDQFGSLRSRFAEVLDGLRDALVVGDLALAAKVLWLSIQVEWQKGVAAVTVIWQVGWEGLLASMQIIGEQVRKTLEDALIIGKAAAQQAGAQVQSWAQGVFHRLIDWLAGAMVDNFKASVIFGVPDDQLTDEQKAELRRATQDLIRQSAEQRGKDAGAGLEAKRHQIEQQRAKEQAEADQRHAEAMEELEGKLADAITGATHSDEVAKAVAELESARKELQAALIKAKAERAAATRSGGPPRSRAGFSIDELEDRLAGIGEVIQEKLTVAGTFSGHAASGLGVGNATMRIVVATEQTARNTKRIAEAGRAQFA
ncbi:MAG: phage tail tape measure protein [Planctomycetota bacterium]|nr:MAG: phage tail tape measure protein [Planctomycetota bacterium]